MLAEVLEGLGVGQTSRRSTVPPKMNTNRERVYVDGTFGRGGHTRALLGSTFLFLLRAYLFI
jgi:16S rRNA C1402 N4-methylase RsmH